MAGENEAIPSKMHRKYHIAIVYSQIKPKMIRSVRELTAEMIGSLVVLKGIVVRSDAVKPRLSIATFACDVCGNESYLEVFQ